MSRGNSKRLSAPSEYIEGSRQARKGPVGGTRVGADSSGKEPSQFERRYALGSEYNRRSSSAAEARKLAARAIVANNLKDYMASNYGVPMTFEDALDYVEQHGDEELKG